MGQPSVSSTERFNTLVFNLKTCLVWALNMGRPACQSENAMSATLSVCINLNVLFYFISQTGLQPLRCSDRLSQLPVRSLSGTWVIVSGRLDLAKWNIWFSPKRGNNVPIVARNCPQPCGWSWNKVPQVAGMLFGSSHLRIAWPCERLPSKRDKRDAVNMLVGWRTSRALSLSTVSIGSIQNNSGVLLEELLKLFEGWRKALGLTYLAKNGHVLDEHAALVGGPALWDAFRAAFMSLWSKAEYESCHFCVILVTDVREPSLRAEIHFDTVSTN